WVIDFQHAPRLALLLRDDDVQGRDDAVLGVEGRQQEARISAQISADHRLPGDEGATLRRALIGPRHDGADNAWMPPDPGFHKKIVLLGAVTANLAERDRHALGANASGFGQHSAKVTLAKSEAAECRKRSLLSQQPSDGLVGGFIDFPKAFRSIIRQRIE